jgi:hypothetical protein
VLEPPRQIRPRSTYDRPHYALGDADRTPRKVYFSGLAAGRLALADHAPAEAREFLEVAARAAELAGLRPSPEFHSRWGSAARVPAASARPSAPR